MPIIGTSPNKSYQRTDGVRSGAAVCAQAKASDVNNTAALADARENDFATALNAMLMKDGGNTPTSNLPMGGFKHTGVGEATGSGQYLEFSQANDLFQPLNEILSDLSSNDTVPAPEGTVVVFRQSTAPTGWTKDTADTDAAMRITSGSVTNGGSTAFSTVFTNRTIASSNLPVTSPWQIVDGGHAHTYTRYSGKGGGTYYELQQFWYTDGTYNTGTSSANVSMGSNSSGGQAMDFRVKYVDVISATRNARA